MTVREIKSGKDLKASPSAAEAAVNYFSQMMTFQIGSDSEATVMEKDLLSSALL